MYEIEQMETAIQRAHQLTAALIVLLGLLGATGASAQSWEPEITADSWFIASAADQPGELVVRTTLGAGWHVYAIGDDASANPNATRIELKPSSEYQLLGPFRALTPAEPVGQADPDSDGGAGAGTPAYKVHRREAIWAAPLRLSPGVEPGQLAIHGVLVVQPCKANLCMPAKRLPLTATLRDQTTAAPQAQAAGNPLPDAPPQVAQLSAGSWIVIAMGSMGGVILLAAALSLWRSARTGRP